MVVERFDVFLVRLDPTEGSEIKKTRPCLVISPDEMNRHLHTALVAPMTTKSTLWPFKDLRRPSVSTLSKELEELLGLLLHEAKSLCDG